MAKEDNKSRKEIEDKILSTSTIVENTLKSVANQVGDIFRDALEQTDNITQVFGKDIERQLKSMAKSTDKIIENEIKIRSGQASSKDIQKQINNYEVQRIILQKRIINLSTTDNELKEQLLKQLHDVDEANKDYIESLEEQLYRTKQIENRVGSLGAILSGITKIPIVGEFIKAEKALDAMKEKAAETSNRISVIAAGLKSLGSGASSLILGKVFTTILDRAKKIDDNSASLARTLGVTYDSAAKLNDNLIKAARSSGNLYATAESYSKTLLEINQTLGISSQLDQKRIDFYTKLRDVAKFEPEILASVNEASYLNNTLLDNTVKTRITQIRLYKIQNGVAINERQVLKDIAAVSNTIKLNFIGSDAALSRAATQARAMGIDLNKVDSIAGSLVDFESSIRSQMEAQVLLGKEINLDKARYFANTNQTEKLLQEINKQGLNEQQFTKATRIERESHAQAIGLSVEELSKMYIQQRVLRNLGAQDITDAKQKYNELVKQKGVAEAQKQLGDEALATQFEQQSVQERTSMTLEKIASSFDNTASALVKVGDGLVDMVGMLAKAETFLKSITIIVGLLAAKRLSNLIPNIPTGGGAGMASAGKFLKGGGALGLGAIATSYASEMAARSGNKGLSTGLDITSSALTGAGYGLMLGGPWGALAGGLLGAGYGAYQSLDEGGLVTQGGIAKVDTGEVYLGKSSIETLREMLSELKKQTQYIQQQGNIQINMDGAAVAASVSKNSSNTFAASNLGPRPLDYTL